MKDASGALRKDPQRRNKNEPKPRPGWPEIPEEVEADDYARAKWFQTCQTLDEMRILTTADLDLLAAFCRTYSEYRKRLAHMDEHGITFDTEKGPKITPQAQDVHKYADRMLKQIAELGLTPSARSRIKVPDSKEDSGLAALAERMSGVN